jgi:hypothetical protein
VDVYSGAIFSNLMSIFIIIATAATLHAIGKNNINTAADAARALEPVAGHFAGVIFAVGLVGASLLAAAVLPLATSYAVSEAFGFLAFPGAQVRRRALFFLMRTRKGRKKPLLTSGTAAFARRFLFGRPLTSAHRLRIRFPAKPPWLSPTRLAD